MTTVSIESLPVRREPDVVTVRQHIRGVAAKVGLSLMDQTMLVTAASELARNTITYGAGGTVLVETLNGPRSGVRLTFEDNGPGIPDIEQALHDGFTTGSGLGLGLGGAKRLVSEFDIVSHVGEGTRVTITHWKGTLGPDPLSAREGLSGKHRKSGQSQGRGRKQIDGRKRARAV